MTDRSLLLHTSYTPAAEAQRRPARDCFWFLVLTSFSIYHVHDVHEMGSSKNTQDDTPYTIQQQEDKPPPPTTSHHIIINDGVVV